MEQPIIVLALQFFASLDCYLLSPFIAMASMGETAGMPSAFMSHVLQG
jgi:hypothetical protein